MFIDDILVFSKSAAEHKQHLDAVVAVLRENKTLIKASKCVWGQFELACLGHVICREGIKPDPKKVQSVVDWPRPTCLREVLQFLGLTDFCIKYMQGYANLTRPRTDLSQKNVPFVWTNACSAFRNLKHALTTVPVFFFFGFT